MNRKHFLTLVCVVVGLVCSRASAQSNYVLYDNNNTGDPVAFTNSLGTASTNGSLIVFEGELESFVNVPKEYNTVSDRYLASLQLLTQVRLFDELPTSNEVGSVQGAVAALRDYVGAPTGIYYVWGLSNSVPVWLQLLTANTPPTTFAVNDGETNYVTFVFSYPTNANPVTYQVYIGQVTDQIMQPSLPVTSPTSETNGINSVSMLGVGGLMEVGTASGAPGPLSTAVDFSVYATTNGVRIELSTVNENGNGLITVYALINGVWTPVGTVLAAGEGSHTYYLYANGLAIGQSYWFKIVDEANHPHYSTSAVEVKEIKMQAVTLAMDYLQVTFNTEFGRDYQVKVSEDLSVAVDQWATEYVKVYDAGAGLWSDYVQTFKAGPGVQTTIQIPRSGGKSFFKVIMIDKPAE